MKIKPHQKIRLTRKLIKKWGACESGLDSAKGILPLTISTDPDQNIRAAQKILGSETLATWNALWPWHSGTEGLYEDYHAFRRHLAQELTAKWAESGYHSGNATTVPEARLDTLPQALAAMADSLLTRHRMRAVKAK